MKIYTERRGNLRNNWRVFMRLCRPSSQPSTLFFQLAPPLELSLSLYLVCVSGHVGFEASRLVPGLIAHAAARAAPPPRSSSYSSFESRGLKLQLMSRELFFFLDKVQWRPPITNQRSPLPNLPNTLRPLFGKYFNTLFLHGPKRFRGSLCWESVLQESW